MKIYRCDKCKTTRDVEEGNYPKDWFLVKIFSKPSKLMKGQKSQGYHLCKKCKEDIFGK